MDKRKEDLLVKYYTGQIEPDEAQELADRMGGEADTIVNRVMDLYSSLPRERKDEVLAYHKITDEELAPKVAAAFREAAHDESCPDCRARMLESIGEKSGNA